MPFDSATLAKRTRTPPRKISLVVFSIGVDEQMISYFLEFFIQLGDSLPTALQILRADRFSVSPHSTYKLEFVYFNPHIEYSSSMHGVLYSIYLSISLGNNSAAFSFTKLYFLTASVLFRRKSLNVM